MVSRLLSPAMARRRSWLVGLHGINTSARLPLGRTSRQSSVGEQAATAATSATAPTLPGHGRLKLVRRTKVCSGKLSRHMRGQLRLIQALSSDALDNMEPFNP
jgi:hypothetical protein